MESSKTDSDDNFQSPESGTHGGKRRGSGRKRKHEEGYENVHEASSGIFDTRRGWPNFTFLHAFNAMESSKTDSDDNFQSPESGTHGGKRRGSGRKRKHEEGYENVRTKCDLEDHFLAQ
ncbi:Hypothetical predicted protein [Paramuricea clavata]|uniref:Uncharacterized protein n=1 Tax=Paramuricea clavata TaxID=317549 RepID=A0A6S7I823_PARCT|nr:Hypothetical predicted protein [Paramuricea clavata]